MRRRLAYVIRSQYWSRKHTINNFISSFSIVAPNRRRHVTCFMPRQHQECALSDNQFLSLCFHKFTVGRSHLHPIEEKTQRTFELSIQCVAKSDIFSVFCTVKLNAAQRILRKRLYTIEMTAVSRLGVYSMRMRDERKLSHRYVIGLHWTFRSKICC